MYKLIFALFIIILITSGCTTNKENTSNMQQEQTLALDNSKSGETQLAAAIKSYVEDQYNLNLSIMNIEEVQHFSEMSVAAFTYQNNKIDYNGIVVAVEEGDKWVIKEIDIIETDTKIDLTRQQLIGSVSTGRKYHIVTGYIGDKKIKSIELIYDNGDYIEKIIGDDQKYYLDVVFGEVRLESIAARNKNGRVVFEETY
ncbi:hypothetical protein [Sutcliffiella cohnii]|uniref:hypothetical protein n=1 Tax=Sutcliffiella cohnii TaxID=33932 RepID=UPI000831BD3B|nr:hypothetical protein [Sutcliffiella cohnii]